MQTLLAAAFAASVVLTNPVAPERCDRIEIQRGDPFLEVEYINSSEHCSHGGTWILELEGVRVSVTVAFHDEDHREHIQVKVLDDLPFEIIPEPEAYIEDNGEPLIFILIPNMS